MSSVCQRQLSAATAAALLGLPVAAAVAQQSGSEASLREKLVLSEAAIKGLTESLAVANGEAEVFRRKSDDLNERIEALGLSSSKGDDALRTRLLAAVRDLRLLQKENDEAKERLTALSESVMALLKTSEGINAKARLRVEENLRAANALIGRSASGQGNPAGLTGGRVIDVKPDLALVVSDLGSRQGVKTGMPFQVWRGDKQIASVRVVDVRDAVSGAIVQSTAANTESVRTGDTLRIDTTR
ncbi:MAG: hypothetical protein EBR40_05765 [Proteobacteria bacterium]|nr:hypothetical protein [Pseudomonadota bacterium]